MIVNHDIVIDAIDEWVTRMEQDGINFTEMWERGSW